MMIKGSNKVKYIEESMEAILKRDQRTTSHRVVDCCEKNDHCQNYNVTISNDRRNNIDNHDNFQVLMTDEKYFNIHKCKDIRKSKKIDSERIEFRNFNSTIMRLVFSVILMLLVIPIQSAPIKMNPKEAMKDPEETLPWDNPCGLERDFLENLQANFNETNGTDAYLDSIRPVLDTVKMALLHAQMFRDKFVKETLQVDPEDTANLFRNQHYDWLPSTEDIPKNLGRRLSTDILERLEVRMIDEIFKSAYYYLQQYSVAIEQIAWDHKIHHTEFASEIESLRTKNLGVLCEIQMVMIGRRIKPTKPPSRQIMPENVRELDHSFTSMRDWIVLRDYMNSLEYLTEIFTHYVAMADL